MIYSQLPFTSNYRMYYWTVQLQYSFNAKKKRPSQIKKSPKMHKEQYERPNSEMIGGYPDVESPKVQRRAFGREIWF